MWLAEKFLPALLKKERRLRDTLRDQACPDLHHLASVTAPTDPEVY